MKPAVPRQDPPADRAPVLGVISNRYSDGNGGTSALAGFALAQPDVVFADPPDRTALTHALASFAQAGIGVLAIDGGDGTIRDVLSALPAAFGDDLPVLALLPSGKTNLLARDVGSFGRGVAGLSHLLKTLRSGASPGRISDRPVLEVVWPDGGHQTVRGMLFGAGVFTHGTVMAHPWAHDFGLKHWAGVLVPVIRILGEVLFGRTPTGGDRVMAVAPDGADGRPGPRFLVLATTLHQLMLGLWPFPAPAPGMIHWLDVAAPPRRLGRALWAAWRGRLDHRYAPTYANGAHDSLSIALHDSFVVDGELFHPGPHGVVLRAGPVTRFIAAA